MIFPEIIRDLMFIHLLGTLAFLSYYALEGTPRGSRNKISND